MPEEIKRYDIEGSDAMTTVIDKLLNSCPLLDGEEIIFSKLGKDSGIGWFPVTGAVITLERKSVTGIVNQECNYPFHIIYRAGEAAQAKVKIEIKEFLDNIGRWLERQEVSGFRLEQYPELSGERKITNISRQTPGYLDSTDGTVEDWAILIAVRYTNKFRRK